MWRTEWGDLGLYPMDLGALQGWGQRGLDWVLPWVAMGEYLDPVWLCHINGVGCPWH